VEAPFSLFDSEFLNKLEQLHLLSRKIFRGEQHAERRSRQTGSSLEFADYRNYTPGDDLRAVDWNVYGRLNRLFVKLFEAEEDLSVSILLDCSASMHWRPSVNVASMAASLAAAPLSKFDHARRTAAALSYIALANLDRVNLFPYGAELGTDLGFVRGKQQFHSLLEFLKRLSEPMPGPTDLQRSFRNFASRLKRRGLVFVLGDLFDPNAAEAVRFLKQQRFEVFVIQTLDEGEIHPKLDGDFKLEETESGAVMDIIASPALLASYRAEFTRFTETLERTCRQHAIGFTQNTTAVPFEDLVLRVLRERQLVK
jgi:uncharacterized protein (DUF58 family)